MCGSLFCGLYSCYNRLMMEMLGGMIGYVICVFLITLFSMILHELAHGFVALRLGDRTAKDSGRLSLNPIKHIDPMMTVVVPVILAMIGAPIFGGAKPVPINTRNLKYREWGFALVAIAGPLTNFLLAFLFFLIGRMTNSFEIIGGGYVSISNFFGAFTLLGVMVNLGFMLFNIIPIPPLDGSRVLYAIAPEGSIRMAMEGIEKYGIVIIYICLLCFGTVLSSYMSGATNAIVQLFTMVTGG